MADRAERALPKGARRFEVRAFEKRTWRIYDRARGSWPINTPWTGKVPQKMDQAQAEALADRLEEQRG